MFLYQDHIVAIKRIVNNAPYSGKLIHRNKQVHESDSETGVRD